MTNLHLIKTFTLIVFSSFVFVGCETPVNISNYKTENDSLETVNSKNEVKQIAFLSNTDFDVIINKGTAIEQFILGHLYEFGESIGPIKIEKDISRARKLYERAASAGLSYAQVQLGLMYLEGKAEVKKNPQLAIRFLREASLKGNYLANCQLGLLSILGDNSENVWLKTEPLLKNAVLKRYPPAMMLYLSIAINPDFKTSITPDEIIFVSKKYDIQYAPLAYIIGYYYLGMSNTKDALAQFQTAARHNYAPALNALGSIFQNGIGVPKDMKKSYEFYKKSADLGYGIAEANLFSFYVNGGPIPKDEAKAFLTTKKLAEINNPIAIHNLAYCYSKGIGVASDNAKGIYYYHKAASQGLIVSELSLGDIYFFGKGTEININEALRFYKMAAIAGHPRAMYMVSEILDDKKYEHKNKELSFHWLKKSADLNFNFALANLGLCYLNGDRVKKDYEKAFIYFSGAAIQNIPLAQNNLGSMFVNNLGKEKDDVAALAWFLISAANNYELALSNISFLQKKMSESEIEKAKSMSVEISRLIESSDEQNKYRSYVSELTQSDINNTVTRYELTQEFYDSIIEHSNIFPEELLLKDLDLDIFTAATRGKIYLLKMALDFGGDVNEVYQFVLKPSLIHIAVLKNDYEMCQFLLNKGADLNYKMSTGETPLMTAVIKNNSEIVELLVNSGAKVNQAYQNGSLPIHYAAYNGNLKMVKKLVANHADTKALDTNGKTAYELSKKNWGGITDDEKVAKFGVTKYLQEQMRNN
jgi:TPR repeat protein